jgi:mono/diheme cytochrome c family protein
MKKTKLIAVAVGILLLCLTLVYHPLRLSGTVQAASNQASGKALYQKNCASCHGDDGRAKTFRGKLTHAQNIASSDWQANNSDEDIAEAIRTGPKKMPSFSKKLSAADINALTQYVRTLKK